MRSALKNFVIVIRRLAPLLLNFENGCFLADCEIVGEIRDDFVRIFLECREVTEKYRSGRSATLKLGQLVMRLFAELL